MKYCNVVRDLAHKARDWIWYDKQFQLLLAHSFFMYKNLFYKNIVTKICETDRMIS